MNHSSTDLVYMALGAVLIALCSWITVRRRFPLPCRPSRCFSSFPPWGGKRGTVTILVYIALGAAGVPVFSQFGAGPGVLLAIPAATSWAFLPWDLPIGGSPLFWERQERSGSWGFSGPGGPLCLWHRLVPSSLHQGSGKYGDLSRSWLVRLSLCDPGPCEAGTCPGSGAAAGKESFSSVIAIKMPAVF